MLKFLFFIIKRIGEFILEDVIIGGIIRASNTIKKVIEPSWKALFN